MPENLLANLFIIFPSGGLRIFIDFAYSYISSVWNDNCQIVGAKK